MALPPRTRRGLQAVAAALHRKVARRTFSSSSSPSASSDSSGESSDGDCEGHTCMHSRGSVGICISEEELQPTPLHEVAKVLRHARSLVRTAKQESQDKADDDVGGKDPLFPFGGGWLCSKRALARCMRRRRRLLRIGLALLLLLHVAGLVVVVGVVVTADDMRGAAGHELRLDPFPGGGLGLPAGLAEEAERGHPTAVR